uniref:HAT C-terminal dimerisation domain-containing protein n=1 Tax=Lactuca sativa TaxID=4236 RepID=A0A9R1VB63_LACSA|nr:hypothetical protein LSAT_V11C500289390 [Lactuca sativa]
MHRFYDTCYLETLAPGGTCRKAHNLDKEVIQEQFATFNMKNGLYSIPATQMDAVTMESIDWWSTYGTETPELAEMAKKKSIDITYKQLFSYWSTFSKPCKCVVFGVKRNRLSCKRDDKIVFVHLNIRLSSRFTKEYKEGSHKKWDIDPESTNLGGSRLEDMEWEDLEEDEDNGQRKKQRVE